MNQGIDDGPELPRKSINLWRDPIMVRLHKSGCSLRQIAAGFEISHEGVRSALSRQGVTGKDRSRPVEAELVEALRMVMQHGRIDDSESRMNTVAALIAKHGEQK